MSPIANPIATPHGWGVCISPQLVWQYGGWIADQELAMLQPKTWLNWYFEPFASFDAEAAAGFIPMLWSEYGLDKAIGLSASAKSLTTWQRLRGWIANRKRKATAEAAMKNALAERPSATWLLWNEPDRRDQANMTPRQAYRATQKFLRAAWDLETNDMDYEFRWAAPGVWIDAQEGLDWATEYVRLLRRHGITRPFYWHIHSYRSVSLRHFEQGWREWQAWYATWGVGAPVVLSEVCAEGADFATQRAIMDEVRAMLTRGDVVGAYWYSTHIYKDVWPTSSLCSVDTDAQKVTLTPLGEHWVSLK